MKTISSFVTLFAMLFVLGASSNAGATNFFSWGVESDSIPSTGQKVIQYHPGSSRSSDTAHTGSYSMKHIIEGDDGGNQQRGVDLSSQIQLPYNVIGSPPIYYRWWMKIMPGFSWGNFISPVSKANRVSGTIVSRVYTGFIGRDGFHLEGCDQQISSNCPGGGRVTLRYNMAPMDDGQWHEYIAMVKPNSSATSKDAEFKVWIDGNQVGYVNNFLLHTTAGNGYVERWGGWMVKPYFQLKGTVSDGGIIYIDDFSTDDAWNSSFAAGAAPLFPGNIQ